jgi:hypothetical protein
MRSIILGGVRRIRLVVETRECRQNSDESDLVLREIWTGSNRSGTP